MFINSVIIVNEKKQRHSMAFQGPSQPAAIPDAWESAGVEALFNIASLAGAYGSIALF